MIKDHSCLMCVLSSGLVLMEIVACSGSPAASVAHSDSTTTQDSAVASTAVLLGSWALDEASGNLAGDTSGKGNNASLQQAPTWALGKVNSGLHFDGVGQYASTGAAVLDTSGSFSVSAWVQVYGTNGFVTAVSQDGANVSGFYLQYVPTTAAAGNFAFSMLASDNTAAAATRVTAPFSALPHVWYHLAGVYDAVAKTATLYVNGQQAATSKVPPAWRSSGPLAIGRGRYGAKASDFFPGLVDEVRAYSGVLTGQNVLALYQAAPMASPMRPPAVPLIVRSPYVSTWQRSDTAPGTWPTFWAGAVKAITGIVRVDGTAYAFFGAPANVPGLQIAQQTQMEMTATQSRYAFIAGPVSLNVNFVSPVEASNLRLLSAPLGYVYVQAQTADGAAHKVQVYMDVSGEWAHSNLAQAINWQYTNVGSTQAWSVQAASPTVLAESNDYPSWGTAVFASSGAGMTYQSGPDITVRSQAASQGKLLNSVDGNMPRAINNNWPVFAFNYDLGTLNGAASAPMVFCIGNVRTPAVSYLGQSVNGLWQSYWNTWQQMVSDMYADAASLATLTRANALDAALSEQAVAAGGAHYAALTALALRQTFAGTELVGTASNPWLFLKEISSDGNLQTVDVLYPSMPGFLWASPTLVKLLLAPVLTYAESGNWPEVYAPHDLGASYPNASGHNDGGGENMPVEESANMLIMAAAYLQATPTDVAFAQAHYAKFSQWANYLVANALDPGLQNQTDDFTGFIAHSSNLALKGILAIGAMGQIAKLDGNTADAQRYTSIAQSYISQWVSKSQDSSGKHLKLAYDLDGTWSLKYNAFPDRLLGLNLIPAAVYQEEASWYAAQAATFGYPLDNRHGYTKSDWEMWTAASTNDLGLRQQIVDRLYAYTNQTPSRVPFSDWYETSSAVSDAFEARPVAGGMFTILDRIVAHP